MYQLIKIASEAAWFPPKRTTWGGKTADLAGFAHEVRKMRNLVHPGVWARERAGTTKFTKGAYDDIYEVFEVATSWLLHRVHKSLLKRMEADEMRRHHTEDPVGHRRP
jgi:hypothetical protein